MVPVGSDHAKGRERNNTNANGMEVHGLKALLIASQTSCWAAGYSGCHETEHNKPLTAQCGQRINYHYLMERLKVGEIYVFDILV